MRPPAIQAERPPERGPLAGAGPRFNEAACNTGGTPSSPWMPTAWSRTFNEAACNTGGTPRDRRRADRPPARAFNEAACNTGGTPWRAVGGGPARRRLQ